MSEFGIPVTLATPWGSIAFNSYVAPYYRLEKIDGLSSPSLRTLATSLSARDGERVHRAYSRGRYPVMSGSVVFGTSLSRRRQMLDDLAAALASIRRADGTLTWTPSGAPHFVELVLELLPAVLLPLDDAAGAPRPRDRSSGANVATTVGTVTFGQPGTLAGLTAALLDGTSGGFTVPHSAALNIADAVNFGIWVKTSASGSSQQLFRKGNTALTAYVETAGRVVLGIAGGSTIAISGTTVVNDGAWRYVEVAKLGATFKIWVDGVDRTGSPANATGAATGTDLNIGRSDLGSNWFNGSLAAPWLRIPAAMPTDAEVAARYAAGANAIATWRRQLTVRSWEALQVSDADVVRKAFMFSLAAADPTIVAALLQSIDSTLLSVATGAGTWALGDAGAAANWALGTAGAAANWALGSGVSPGIAVVTNVGNADSWPKLRIVGAVDGAVRVTNLTTGRSIVFSALNVAAGHYAEIDTWNETVYLDGAENATLLGGLDSSSSDFFPLAPGVNALQLSADSYDAAAKLTVLFRDGWA